MRSFAIACAVLALAACSAGSDIPIPTSAGSSAGSTGTSGGKATSATTSGTTSAAASSTGAATSSNGTTGTAAAASSTGGPGTTGGAGATAGAGTTTGVNLLGKPCTFDTTTFVDSCAGQGYECSIELTGADAGDCVLPQEQGACFTTVGCQDGGTPNLLCTPGFSRGGVNLDICLYPCKTTSDCASVTESCLTTVAACFSNYCDQTATGAFQGPFFNTCPVLDAGDGQCIPLNDDGVALCFQNGSATTGITCDPNSRKGIYSECVFGDYCVANATDKTGLCYPITEDDVCPDAGPSTFEDPLQYTNVNDWQFCAPDCSETGTCPFGTCTNLGGTDACLP